MALVSHSFNSVPRAPVSDRTDDSGMCFVHHPETLDKRSMLEKMNSRFYAYCRMFFHMATLHALKERPHPLVLLSPDGKYGTWNHDMSALYIMLNGIGGRPGHWHKYIDEILDHDPDAAIYCPRIDEDDAVDPYEAAVDLAKFISVHLDDMPEVPICVISFSNGARVAASLDLLLESPERRVSFITICGLCYGTTWVDFFNNTLWFLGESKALEAQHFGNDKAKEDILAIRGRDLRRRRAFFVSTEDGSICPWYAAAPCLGGEHVFLVHGLLHEEVFQSMHTIVAKLAFLFCYDSEEFEFSSNVNPVKK